MATVSGVSGVSQLTRLNITDRFFVQGEELTFNSIPQNVIFVRDAEQLSGELSSDIIYFIDGVVDFTGTGYTIDVPADGLTLGGWSFDISKLTCSDAGYTLFTTPVGGSGNLLGSDYAVEVTGAGSQVYDLTAATGSEAFEFSRVNYNGCQSLGEITDYRQGLEAGTGRFGGTPELTLSGNWNGYRITESIVRNLSDITALFKTGTSLLFGGRFITDINCDLPTNGALFDYAASNFSLDESLVVQNAFITRDGVVDASDTTIYPNIDHTSIKSNWGDNTGLPNTKKYIKASVTAEVVTTITIANTFHPLEGTFTVDTGVQFDMPANGEFRLLTGNGSYNITGDISLEGTANDVLDIRVTKSTDDGATWPVEINRIKRVTNNLSGGRDVAFFPLNFITDIKKNERLRLEVQDETAANNVTMELDSYFIITEV